MSGKSTKSGSRASTRSGRARGDRTRGDRAWLRRADDRGIDYSDIARIPDAVLRGARLALPAPKVRVTTHIDADVLAWLKRGGPRYQTRLNSILRQVMSGSRSAPPRRRKSTLSKAG